MSRAIDLNSLSHVIASHDATHASIAVSAVRHGGTALSCDADHASSSSACAAHANDERSRIEAALEGTSDWHLRVNRVARGSLRATYEVVYPRGVPVRGQPHIDSAVIKVIRAGERVVGVSLTGDGWLELLGVDADGENIEGSGGWMLTTHVEHGSLLKQVSGVDLPSTTMRLASSESASTCNHERMPHALETNSYRVLYSPALPMRASARTDASLCGFKVTGDVIQACGRRGDWVELKRSSSDAETPRHWMLTFHPDFGQLLCRVNADGSDAL